MSEPDTPTPGRRQFVAASAAGLAALALAPGVQLLAFGKAEPDEGASAAKRWGMLVDASRCTACGECTRACAAENGIASHDRPRSDPQWIRLVELKDPRSGRTASAPVMCQHCAEPPCVDVCPTGASFRRVDGVVLVDRHTCIGCRYCMMACPYKARSFVHEPLTGQKADVPRGKGCVESCTLCVHRLDRGEQPACVEACASAGHRALVFGDLKDATSEIARRVAAEASSQIRADLRLDPGVRYQGI